MTYQTNLKMATWNICLGLPNKINIVTDYLRFNNVSVCCLQETEVPSNFPVQLLSTDNYNLELETNDCKSRSGILIRNDVKYVRRNDLELKNLHVVICDLNLHVPIRIVCLYRSFRPPGMQSPLTFFNNQIALLRNCLTSNCLIMGDFNLDANLIHRPDYIYKANS